MVEWWGKYFSASSIEKIKLLLETGRVVPPNHDAILEQAALCRLSFASLKLDVQEPPSFGGCPCQEAIISQTSSEMKRSRPATAKWAFWFAYILKRSLEIDGKPPTARFLAKLVAILLNREVTGEEVRIKFVQLRKKAIDNATETARILFRKNLSPKLSDTEYEARLRNCVEKSPETTQLGWFIVDGKIPEERLRAVIKIRREILLNIGIFGQLIGREPLIIVQQASTLIQGIPIPIGGFHFNSPIQKGTIHLDKANEIPLPEPYLQQSTKPVQKTSLSFDKNGQGDVTMNLKFPTEAFTDGEPHAAALFVVPSWWPIWVTYMPLALLRFEFIKRPVP